MQYQDLISYLIGPAVVGLVVWVWVLWMSHMNHKVHVAENYVRKPEIENLGKIMTDIQNQLSEVLKTVHELKGRMEVK